MDLRDGQTFAIAGLIDNQVQQQLDKIPGIGDIPILGKLFQSHSTTKSRDELLVIVTPRIVRPLTPNEVPPGPQIHDSVPCCRRGRTDERTTGGNSGAIREKLNGVDFWNRD